MAYHETKQWEQLRILYIEPREWLGYFNTLMPEALGYITSNTSGETYLVMRKAYFIVKYPESSRTRIWHRLLTMTYDQCYIS